MFVVDGEVKAVEVEVTVKRRTRVVGSRGDAPNLNRLACGCLELRPVCCVQPMCRYGRPVPALIHCSLSTVRCPLSAVRCPLPAAWCRLVATRGHSTSGERVAQSSDSGQFSPGKPTRPLPQRRLNGASRPSPPPFDSWLPSMHVDGRCRSDLTAAWPREGVGLYSILRNTRQPGLCGLCSVL